MLTAFTLYKDYKKGDVLKNASFSLPSKGLFVLYGANGSGKSTLLRIVSGEEKPKKGFVAWNGETRKRRSFRFAFFVPSVFSFDEKKSVKDNLSLPFSKYDEAKAEFLLSCFGMQELRNHKVKELSEGEKRRLSLVIGFLSECPAVLFDEPFASLDEDNRIKVLSLLKREAENRLILFASNQKQDLALEGLAGTLVLEQGIVNQTGKSDDGVPPAIKKKRMGFPAPLENS